MKPTLTDKEIQEITSQNPALIQRILSNFLNENQELITIQFQDPELIQRILNSFLSENQDLINNLL